MPPARSTSEKEERFSWIALPFSPGPLSKGYAKSETRRGPVASPLSRGFRAHDDLADEMAAGSPRRPAVMSYRCGDGLTRQLSRRPSLRRSRTARRQSRPRRAAARPVIRATGPARTRRSARTPGAAVSPGRESSRGASDSAPPAHPGPSAAWPDPRRRASARRPRGPACADDGEGRDERSWQRLDFDRDDVGQMLPERDSVVARLGRAVHPTTGRPEVDPARVERVDGHRVAEHVDVAVALRQPSCERLPLVATGPAAVHAQLAVGRIVLGVALDRDDVDRLGLVRVHVDRESE